jgi:hypothetical protein
MINTKTIAAEINALILTYSLENGNHYYVQLTQQRWLSMRKTYQARAEHVHQMYTHLERTTEIKKKDYIAHTPLQINEKYKLKCA